MLTLKQGLYKVQFKQFAWTHITLMIIVTQSTFVVQNLLRGIIWSVAACRAFRCG